MDLQCSAEQRAIVESVEAMCAKQAGAKRAIVLDRDAGYDYALHAALHDAGFFDVVREASLLEGVLVAEVLARHAAVVSFGATGIVLAALKDTAPHTIVALFEGREATPSRFAQHASLALRLDGDEAVLCTLEAGQAQAVPSSFMFPFGMIPSGMKGDSLGSHSGARARDVARLALAAECVGAMDAALDLTVSYVTQRRQFGRAIGSFQAVQHRLAHAKVCVEGARLLTYEAACKNADSERVAVAAAHATQAARLVHNETHQLTGALGFTREHDLFVWSMRLQALRVELGGTTAHRRALASARWGLKA